MAEGYEDQEGEVTKPRRGTAWRIQRLSQQLERYKIIAGNLAEERDAMAEELDGLKKSAEAWEKEKAELTARGDSNAERKRAEALQQQIRDIRHRDAFYKKVRDAGAPTDVVEDLWNLAGFKPEKDEVDDEAIQDVVNTLKSSKPRWFESRSPQDAASGAAEGQTGRKPSPAAGRGDGMQGPRGKTYTTADMQDPRKAMDPAFRKEYDLAVKEGRVQRVGIDAVAPAG